MGNLAQKYTEEEFQKILNSNIPEREFYKFYQDFKEINRKQVENFSKLEIEKIISYMTVKEFRQILTSYEKSDFRKKIFNYIDSIDNAGQSYKAFCTWKPIMKVL